MDYNTIQQLATLLSSGNVEKVEFEYPDVSYVRNYLPSLFTRCPLASCREGEQIRITYIGPSYAYKWSFNNGILTLHFK